LYFPVPGIVFMTVSFHNKGSLAWMHLSPECWSCTHSPPPPRP
jgi:hypothetical protein